MIEKAPEGNKARLRGHGLLSAWLAVALLVSGAGGAAAQEPDYLNFGAGVFNIGDPDRSTVFHGEYRFGTKLWLVEPFLGVMGTTDRSVYVFGGLALEIELTERIVLRPNLAAGVYRRGDGVDLGFPLEFRSDLELAYTFDDRSRVGISFHHISNADLGDTNPGTEVLRIGYSVPIRPLF